MVSVNYIIMPNVKKPEAMKFTPVVADYLRSKGQKVFVMPDITSLLSGFDFEVATPEDIPDDSMVISLGGDGTLIRNVRRLGRYDMPVAGINFGHLGFLTACNPDGAFELLDRIVLRNYATVSRMLLNVRLCRNNGVVKSELALNEAAISRGTCSRALSIRLSVGGENLGTFTADGLLVSTPTGSTAYNFSAGGPVILPNVDAIAVTPLCSRLLLNHSFIASGSDTVSIETQMPAEPDDGASPILVVDSCVRCSIKSSDVIKISKSEYSIKTVCPLDSGSVISYRKKIIQSEK